LNLIEEKLISRIILDKKLPKEVGFKYFGKHGDVMLFIEEFYKKYKTTPSEETVQNDFPDFDTTLTSEPLEYYEDQIIEDYQTRNALSNIEVAINQIQGGKLKEGTDTCLQIYRNYKTKTDELDYDNYDESIYKMYDFRQNLTGKSWQFETFNSLNTFIPSFNGGEFHVLVGRPKMGKTYIALAMALDLYRQGARVGIASAEMNRETMIGRIDRLATQLSPVYFNQGTTTLSFQKMIERQRIKDKKTGGKLAFIGFERDNDLYTGTVNDLSRYVKDLNLDVLIIDSLYMYKANIKRNSNWENTIEVIREAVSLTRQNKVLTIATTQFAKQGARKKGGSAEDVAYSDAFLQYCDSLIGVSADENTQLAHMRNLNVLAVREGEIGQCIIKYEFEPNLNISDYGTFDIEN
jgi:DNA replication protein DnaC